jgi:hypothetical protein
VDTVPTKPVPANPWPGAEVSLCKKSLRLTAARVVFHRPAKDQKLIEESQ